MKKIFPRLQWVSLGLSVLLGATMAHCYFWRGDFYVALTVWPVWTWAILGLALAAMGWRKSRRLAVLLVMILWGLYLVFFAEEVRSLVRFSRWPVQDWDAMRMRGDGFRVISLNCSTGTPSAAAEVGQYHPDVVLLQESPKLSVVEELAQRFFGQDAGVVWGPDASLLVRGKVQARELLSQNRGHVVQARVRLTSGIEVEVVSLRLMPSVLREDFWAPSCWRSYTEDRRDRREQLRIVAQQIETVPFTIPIVFGGDFNAPQGDAIFRLLQPRLHDSFLEAGRGWGNTILNDLPGLRIDQLWLSDSLRSTAVVTRTTKNSDHRMVICDVVLRNREKYSSQ